LNKKEKKKQNRKNRFLERREWSHIYDLWMRKYESVFIFFLNPLYYLPFPPNRSRGEED